MGAEYISAIAAAISAVSALIAVLVQLKSNNDIKKEKRLLYKPKFILIGYSKTIEKFEFRVKNVGYPQLSQLKAMWIGEENQEVSVESIIDSNKNYDYIITLDFTNKLKVGNIEGKLQIAYLNILNEELTEECKLLFKTKNYDGKIHFCEEWADMEKVFLQVN